MSHYICGGYQLQCSQSETVAEALTKEFKTAKAETLLPNLAEYKTTSSEFIPLTTPIKTKAFEVEEKMVSTFTSRTKRTYINLKKHRDNALTKAITKAIAEVAQEFPDYSCFALFGSAEVFFYGLLPIELTAFRLTASRNDKERKVFITIQLKYESQRLLQARALERAPVIIPDTYSE